MTSSMLFASQAVFSLITNGPVSMCCQIKLQLQPCTCHIRQMNGVRVIMAAIPQDNIDTWPCIYYISSAFCMRLMSRVTTGSHKRGILSENLKHQEKNKKQISHQLPKLSSTSSAEELESYNPAADVQRQ